MSEIDEKDLEMLKILYDDCRVSVSEMARELDISRWKTKKRLEWLEEELGLGYGIDVDKRKVGLKFNAIVKIKSEKDIPREEIVDAFEEDERVQFVVLTKGDFNLIIYVSSKDTNGFDRWEIKTKIKLNKYIKEWDTLTLLKRRYGFLPMRRETWELIDLGENKEEIIKTLDGNARIKLKDLAEKLNMSPSLARYHLDKIFEMKQVKIKPILSQEVQPVQLVSFKKVNFPKEFKEINRKSREFYHSKLENICLHERITGDMDTFIISAFDDIEKLRSFEEREKKINEGRLVAYESGIILGIPIGKLNICPFGREENWKASRY